MARVFLSIGSNIEPEVHFKQCATALTKHFHKPCWSPVYRSAAVGMDGDDFLNAVVRIDTDWTIEAINAQLKQIEHECGRIRSEKKFSSRTMDIDMLLFDEVILNNDTITLPRPEITSAAHVLKPLAELEPSGMHPVLNKTYMQLLNELEQVNPNTRSSLALVELKLED